MGGHEYVVRIKKKVLKDVPRLPATIQNKLLILIEDLRQSGPVQAKWPNYNKLSRNEYHCHLAYQWVACWKHEKHTLTIEVYYAGSRENAPY